MTRAYRLLNIALLVLAVAVTYLVVEPWAQTTAEGNVSNALREAASGPATAAGMASNNKNPRAPRAEMPDLHELYTQSLFSPERSEVLGQIEATETAATGTLNMELIGIGAMGDTAAAVILVHNRQPRRGPHLGQAEKATTRHVYRLGQQVENTGYIIREISLTEVVLVKGDEERILRLEAADAGSTARKEVATAPQTAKLVQQQLAAQATTAAAAAAKEPGNPPPAPPTPTTNAARRAEFMARMREMREARERNGTPLPPESFDPAAVEDREERIQRALEARRRIIEERRARQEQEESGEIR